MFEPVFYDDYVKAITTNRILGYTGDCYAFFTFLTRQYSDQYIETVARHILNCGCQKCFFYGVDSSDWNMKFDLIDINLHPEAEDVCLTSILEDEEVFMDEIDLAITIVKRPSDIIVLYDDEEKYNGMKTRLLQEERAACDNWYEKTWRCCQCKQ